MHFIYSMLKFVACNSEMFCGTQSEATAFQFKDKCVQQLSALQLSHNLYIILYRIQMMYIDGNLEL